VVAVVYIGIKNDRVKIAGYVGEPSNVKSKVRPGYHVTTSIGYKLSKTYKGNAHVDISDVFMKSYDLDLSRLADDIEDIIAKGDVIFLSLDSDTTKILQLLRYGDTENGMSFIQLKELAGRYRELKEKFIKSKAKSISYAEDDEECVIHWMLSTLQNADMDINESAKVFFKNEKFSHPFIAGGYIVIDPLNYKLDGKYRILNVLYPTPEEIGRPLNQVSERILYIDKLPDMYIAIIEKTVSEIDPDKRLIVIPVDAITNGLYIKLFKETGYKLYIDKTEHAWKFKDAGGTLFAQTVYPPALTRLVTTNSEERESGSYTGSLDIGKYIYDGNTIFKHIPQSGHIIRVMISDAKISARLNVDLPSRNVLKKLEKRYESLTIKYKVSGKMVKFYTEIVLKTGERMITYSPTHSVGFIKRR